MLKVYKKRHMSKEHKLKLSKALKGKYAGKNSPNYGKHRSEETKLKISKSQKGHKGCWLGKHLSKEHKLKLSKAVKGRYKGENSPNWGKHFSKETKLKMSIARRGTNHPLWGKHHTKKTIKKMSLAKKGKKCYRWKGGITSTTIKIRNSEKYQRWRQSVYIRDKFTCCKCGKVGGDLCAHHIKFFSELLEEAEIKSPLLSLYKAAMIYQPIWNLDNGITMCKKCHKKLHKKILDVTED